MVDAEASTRTQYYAFSHLISNSLARWDLDVQPRRRWSEKWLAWTLPKLATILREYVALLDELYNKYND